MEELPPPRHKGV